MDSAQFMAAIRQLADEKNISQDKIMEIAKEAFKAAYRREYGDKEENLEVEIDGNGANVTVLQVMEVVKKSDLVNEDTQMELTAARKLKSDVEEGDILKIDVTPLSYGRIAAQSAKQVIIQRLQEAERESMYEAYKDKEGEIVQATVNRTDGRNVFIDLEKASTVLAQPNQIPSEHYRSGMQIKVYLERVMRTTHGPEIIVSRSHANLVRELFKLEIPEIQNGSVEIKAIAREAGVRTKIAVASSEQGIDPIGACVGQKGVRIQAVMEEINGERIDVIAWNADTKKFIEAALAPATVARIDIDDKGKRIGLYVEEEQRALTIGRSGQNVRLASLLTGYEIDVLNVKDLSEADQKALHAKKEEVAVIASAEPKVENISELGLDEKVVAILQEAGFEKTMQLTGLDAKALQGIPGIDEKAAKAIEAAIK